jgi:copper transport protein
VVSTKRTAARLWLGLLTAVALLALFPANALGHAVLKGTTPLAGAVDKRQPQEIIFRFSEPVEGKFGALRVYDRHGRTVQAGDAYHPRGHSSELATRLKGGLPRGTYTTTYRVISADGHPVSGGLVFSVGKPSIAGASVSELLDRRGGVGDVTEVAFGIARGLQYAAIALALGAVFFLFAIWLPGLAGVAGGREEWRIASERFVARTRAVVGVAIAAGVVSGALGIVLQGATAAGVSFWSALDSEIVGDVLGTRFGTVWGLRVLVWLGLSGALLAALSTARSPVLRPASVGATGLALPRVRRRPLPLTVLLLPLAFLAVSPALAGHASLQSPTGLLVPANIAHVVAVSIWTGGLVLLLAALPAATRRLEPGDRTRLLAAVLARFSTIALVAVVVLVATGVTQALVEVKNLDNLIHTAFGRAVLIKICVLAGPLIALGAYNRQRHLPQLERIAAGGESPGRAGLLLRRSLRLEVALIAGVLGVTAALVSYPPAAAVSKGGIVSERSSLGPADVQLTVDPARVGPNQMHAYLTNKRDGSQFTKVKEFDVQLLLPAKQIGPLKASARKAGPGHYVMNGTVFGATGDWKVKIAARVSEFDAYYATLDVRIR